MTTPTREQDAAARIGNYLNIPSSHITVTTDNGLTTIHLHECDPLHSRAMTNYLRRLAEDNEVAPDQEADGTKTWVLIMSLEGLLRHLPTLPDASARPTTQLTGPEQLEDRNSGWRGW